MNCTKLCIVANNLKKAQFLKIECHLHSKNIFFWNGCQTTFSLIFYDVDTHIVEGILTKFVGMNVFLKWFRCVRFCHLTKEQVFVFSMMCETFCTRTLSGSNREFKFHFSPNLLFCQSESSSQIWFTVSVCWGRIIILAFMSVSLHSSAYLTLITFLIAG